MIPAFHRRNARSRRSLNGVQGFSMNVSILYFLPHIARYRYGITKRDYKHNQFYFLIIQVKFSRLKIFLHLLARNTPIRPMRRFFRNCASPKKTKKRKRCGSRSIPSCLGRKVGWNNVRFRLKRWLNKRFPRDYLPARTAPVNACNTRVDDAAATNLVRVPRWVKGMAGMCIRNVNRGATCRRIVGKVHDVGEGVVSG